MKLEKLIEKLQAVGEREVVGVMLYYTNKPEEFKRVDYFYNPVCEQHEDNNTNNEFKPRNIEETILSLFDVVIFETYNLKKETMASGTRLFTEDVKEISFSDILDDELIANIEFFTMTKVV